MSRGETLDEIQNELQDFSDDLDLRPIFPLKFQVLLTPVSREAILLNRVNLLPWELRTAVQWRRTENRPSMAAKVACHSNCSRTVLELPLEPPSDCTLNAARTALELPSNCRSYCPRNARTALEMPSNCRWNCPRTALELPLELPRTVLELPLKLPICLRTAAPRTALELPPELPANCPRTAAQTALELRSDCRSNCTKVSSGRNKLIRRPYAAFEATK